MENNNSSNANAQNQPNKFVNATSINLANVNGVPIKTGFLNLDKVIDGVTAGEIIVLSGETGNGKSTYMSQALISMAANGVKVCIDSAEMAGATVYSNMLCQMAGSSRCVKIESVTGAVTYKPMSWVHNAVADIAKNIDFYGDNECQDIDDLLDALKEVAKRGTKFFCIDNLMCISAKAATSSEENKQNIIMQKLKKFAKETLSVVFLIVHNRKETDADRNALSINSIKGSNNIVNYADTVLTLRRIDKEAMLKKLNQNKKKGETLLTALDVEDAQLLIHKARRTGARSLIKYHFDTASRRFEEYGSNSVYGRILPWTGPWEQLLDQNDPSRPPEQYTIAGMADDDEGLPF